MPYMLGVLVVGSKAPVASNVCVLNVGKYVGDMVGCFVVGEYVGGLLGGSVAGLVGDMLGPLVVCKYAGGLVLAGGVLEVWVSHR